MANINLNFDELARVANNIRSLGDEFYDLLKNVLQAKEDLRPEWEGTDGAVYAQKIESQAVEMDKLYRAINEVAGYLDRVGVAYRDTINENIAGLRG